MPGLSPDRLALLRKALASKGLGVPQALPVARRTDRQRAPLSPAQERLYFLEAFDPGTALHNDAMAVEIEGALDPERWRTALARVTERHEILRTTFALSGAGPEQRIAEQVELPLVLEDLRRAKEPEAEASRHALADARRPFDLENDLPWRARLARLGEERWLFSCTMHHIASDGASFGILFDELGRAYAGVLEPAAPQVQFGDYACWERAQRDESRTASDLEWWKQHLGGGLTDITWPGAEGPASRSGGLAFLTFAADLPARLTGFAREQGTTTQQVLLAAWLALLGGRTGSTEVRTGMASSLRRRPELSTLIGFFVETQCLRVDLADDPGFEDFLARVRETCLEAARHDRAPFDRVLRAVGHEPLIQVFFSHMKDAVRAPSLPSARTAWRFLDPGVARFELSLVLHESDQALDGFLEHDQALVSSAQAQALAGAYVQLVEAALARPAARLSELATSTPSPRSRSPLPPRPRRAIGG